MEFFDLFSDITARERSSVALPVHLSGGMLHGNWGIVALWFVILFYNIAGEGCLSISYCAQRMKNNWTVFIAHYIFNGMAFVIILVAVLGLL